MSDLFHSLTMAARSLQTQQYGMNVTGQNIANVNTPGYSRRTVTLADVPPSRGGGVEAAGVRAIRDALVERRLLDQVPLGARDAAIAEALAVVETSLGAPGAGLDARLNALFDAFAGLAEDPASVIARRQVQIAGASLTAAFSDVSERLDAARRDADVRIRGAVDEINTLSERIAALNAAIPQARAQGSMPTLEDEQAQLVRRLSELADVQVLNRQEGGVDVTVGNGRPLVVGDNVYALTRTPGAGGYLALGSEGLDISGEIAGGTIGGLLQVRDTVAPRYQALLDRLAFDVAEQINARHADGVDANGAAAGAFFSFSTSLDGTSGAARALRVDPAVAADERAIAAAGVAQPGDNTVARAIAALRHRRVLQDGTATLNDGWVDLVYRVGSDAQAANSARDTQKAIVRQIDALRDQVSGVSLDEEALNLMKFQRAYEANARFFTAVDGMLLTLLNLVK